MKRMIRTAVIWTVAALTLAIGLSTALAAGPNPPDCLGKDVSAMATADGAGFGRFVSGIATSTQGIGDEVQAHQAGEIEGVSCVAD